MVFGWWKKNRISPQIVEEAPSRDSSFNNEGVDVSPASDAKTPAKTSKWVTWMHRLFGQSQSKAKTAPQTKEESSRQQQKLSSSHGPKQRKRSWLCDCCSIEEEDDCPEDQEDCNEVTPVLEFRAEEEETSLEDQEKKKEAVVPQETVSLPSIQDHVDDIVSQKVNRLNFFTGPKRHHITKFINDLQHLRVQQILQLGFPNPAQICYMNSSLQSLLTLDQFVTDLDNQKEVWSWSPEAELISHFMNIVRLRDLENPSHKLQALNMFKRVLSIQAPEFVDSHQKDAHEFITQVLNQMRSLAVPLQKAAAFIGSSYSCPVERNLVFKMQNTRKCKRCGSGSVREEEFTNLSLELNPGVSVQQMLQDYQKETEIEFRCECGCNKSSLCSTFLTLPRFLVLHLKRFRFTQFYQLVKLHHPVNLFKELMVASSQAEDRYSLISVISHLGSGGDSGHYISDGLLPGEDIDAMGDNWLNYNDSEVTITTGESVCKQRKETAYILFFQRRLHPI